MELIEKVIFYHRPDTFALYPLGDLHRGSVFSDEDLAERKVEEIRTTRNAFWIGMGDQADAIIPNDPRFSQDPRTLAPWVKKDDIVYGVERNLKELFLPISSQCLAYLKGNHEEGYKKHSHSDLHAHMIEALGVPDGGYSCFIVLIFKRVNSRESHQVVIHARHGSGGAQSDGAVLNSLKRAVRGNEADIYLMGHLHRVVYDITDRLAVRGHKITAIPRIASMTGSYKKAYMQGAPTSWEETKDFQPSHLGSPRILITPNTRQILYESES